ncbi:MAG: hypothetical protein DMD66_12560 [Gemmatimonadetes bacterium]|nr:MAG: hypothetical protein DMD66_12560 [Gemmatimonadota bacterium]
MVDPVVAMRAAGAAGDLAAALGGAYVTAAVLHLTVFTIGPALYAIYLATTANLPALARDSVTWNALRNTALYALYVPVSVALALLAALAVFRYRQHWGGRLLSTAFVLPYVASAVVIALVWQAIYRWGSFGLGRVDWLNNPRTALPALMLTSVWAHMGGQMVVFLAGLQAIPPAYLDAARVDGAGAWRGFWRVTLPLLRPVTWFVVLTCAHAGWSVAVARHRGHGPSHLSDGIWTADIRAGECGGRRVRCHAPDPEMAAAGDSAPAGSQCVRCYWECSLSAW